MRSTNCWWWSTTPAKSDTAALQRVSHQCQGCRSSPSTTLQSSTGWLQGFFVIIAQEQSQTIDADIRPIISLVQDRPIQQPSEFHPTDICPAKAANCRRRRRYLRDSDRFGSSRQRPGLDRSYPMDSNENFHPQCGTAGQPCQRWQTQALPRPCLPTSSPQQTDPVPSPQAALVSALRLIHPNASKKASQTAASQPGCKPKRTKWLPQPPIGSYPHTTIDLNSKNDPQRLTRDTQRHR